MLRNRAILAGFVGYRRRPSGSKDSLEIQGFAPTPVGRACGLTSQEHARRGRRRYQSYPAWRAAMRRRCSSSRATARSVDAVKADLDTFDALLAESADLRRLVRSPVFGAEEQSQGARRRARQGRHQGAGRELPSVRGVEPPAVRGARHDPRLPHPGRQAQGRGDRRGHRRRETVGRASRRAQERAQVGHRRQGGRSQRQDRSGDHRRAHRQARLPHGRQLRSAPSSIRSSTR